MGLGCGGGGLALALAGEARRWIWPGGQGDGFSLAKGLFSDAFGWRQLLVSVFSTASKTTQTYVERVYRTFARTRYKRRLNTLCVTRFSRRVVHPQTPRPAFCGHVSWGATAFCRDLGALFLLLQPICVLCINNRIGRDLAGCASGPAGKKKKTCTVQVDILFIQQSHLFVLQRLVHYRGNMIRPSFFVAFLCLHTIAARPARVSRVARRQAATTVQTVQSADLVSPISSRIDPTFRNIGLAAGTDKVTHHSYWYTYSRYLNHVRDQPIRLLEIGLGCDMAYGPGHSLKLWRDLLPQASISVVEVNATCMEHWKDKVVEIGRGQVYVGSQDSDELLTAITTDAALDGLYDVIVDDGSHVGQHVLKAHSKLWHALKPGGIYIVEDLQVSNSKAWTPDMSLSAVPFLHKTLDRLLCRSSENFVWHESAANFCQSATLDVVSMDCAPEICVIVKGAPWSFDKLRSMKVPAK